ncbi:MAG: DNA polymerase III subunit alpha, partial [Planctomycetota bacterium]|nr:DNA polymerase III subunit alpha [Planctomycetota bacterium]
MSLAYLNVRTPWSFHYGAAGVEELAVRAAELGVRALGMADFGGIWGAVPFQKACEAEGIRPVFGVRLGPAHLIALNEAGWGGLCRLSTHWMSTPVEEREWGLTRRVSEEVAGISVLSADADFLRGIQKRNPGQECWATTWECAERSGFTLIAAPEIVAARKEDWKRHQLLVAIGKNTTVSKLRSQDLAGKQAYLKSQKETHTFHAYPEEAWRAAAELAERAEFRIPLKEKRRPRFPVPGGRSATAHLARLCQRGWRRRRLGRSGKALEIPLERYRAQLLRELSLIEELEFSDYFLVVADLVQWARGQGIQCCGRGSAANSLVSWLLGFTHVDPLKHGLYFERFMNRGRSDFPDVDLDFAWDERDRVLDYALTRWGQDRLALISTHNTFATRGAVREIAKVMGVPPREISEVTRALSRRLRHVPDAEPWKTIFEEATALDGFPRHTGVHPGGTVLAPGPLTDFLPLQNAKKSTQRGPLTVTQWDMYSIEDAGLLKIDLLGNRGLAVVRDASSMVKKNTGLAVDFSRVVPEQDTATCKLMERGDTMGCFYVESPSMRGLLQKLNCGNFETLVAASSIIRPGISQSGMMRAYIDRHHEVRKNAGSHLDEWYLHPAMRQLLEGTYGVMTYQEDVMKVSEAIAGFDAATADQLRRSMSKKRAWRRLEEWGERFVEGALEKGMNLDTVEELWRQIESFSGYSFCKAHSASYATVSFRSAWLRAHFPAEFMAAVLRNHGGFYSTFAYIEEARRMGLRLQLPCVNQSEEGFSGGAGEIRVGLEEIESLSSTLVQRILNTRKQRGAWKTQEEFCEHLKPHPKELEALVRSGALDTMKDSLNRPERMRMAALW